jgi:phosphatidylinositol glycan class U
MAVASVGTWLAALLLFSRVLAGSWTFLNAVYSFALAAPDLTPNIGLSCPAHSHCPAIHRGFHRAGLCAHERGSSYLRVPRVLEYRFWYFFIEMFDHFKPFFLFIFQYSTAGRPASVKGHLAPASRVLVFIPSARCHT